MACLPFVSQPPSGFNGFPSFNQQLPHMSYVREAERERWMGKKKSLKNLFSLCLACWVNNTMTRRWPESLVMMNIMNRTNRIEFSTFKNAGWKRCLRRQDATGCSTHEKKKKKSIHGTCAVLFIWSQQSLRSTHLVWRIFSVSFSALDFRTRFSFFLFFFLQESNAASYCSCLPWIFLWGCRQLWLEYR